MSDPPPPTELDRRLAELVRSELASCPEGVAELTAELRWTAPGSYLTQVRPGRADAAGFALAYDGCAGGSTLSVTVARTDFALAPFDADRLPYVREVVAAVLGGGVEEISRGTSTYLRLHLEQGRVVVVGVPTTPWRRRRVHRYAAYAP